VTRRYLMRLGKTPFELYNGFSTLDENPIGRNNGNLIFGYAAHKLFSTMDTIVDANHYKISKSFADTANHEYDGFILPLANAFRPSFEAELLRTTEFIENLKIPFLMLSGGVQASSDGDTTHLESMVPLIKRFARAVLDKSSAITVRGTRSAEFFNDLGFSDVEVIGCPSMTLNGRGHQVPSISSITPDAQVAYNIEPSKPIGSNVIDDVNENYDATYMPQDSLTLEMMLWGTEPYPSQGDLFPTHRQHKQFREDIAEFQLDAPAWINRMTDFSLTFGSRIHGNIASILAGTPAVVFAHDQRTLELAQYHEIPHIDVNAEPLPSNVEEVAKRADFAAFNSGHAKRFDKFIKHITDNGFHHIYQDRQHDALIRYREKIEMTRFYSAQKTLWLQEDRLQVEALSRLRSNQSRSTKQLKNAQDKLKKQQAQLKTTQDKLKKQQTQLKTTQDKLKSHQHQLHSVQDELRKITAWRTRTVSIMRKVYRGVRRRARSLKKVRT
jgi:hypothetical protein